MSFGKAWCLLPSQRTRDGHRFRLITQYADQVFRYLSFLFPFLITLNLLIFSHNNGLYPLVVSRGGEGVFHFEIPSGIFYYYKFLKRIL